MLVAKYTASAGGVVPTFNSGYQYTISETENSGVYTVEINSDTDFTSCSFQNKTNLLTVEYLKVTNKTTIMNDMFSSCSSLTQLDVSNWDTSQVTTMGRLFYNCSSLTQLDVSNWDTSKVINMSNMFQNCLKLKKIKLLNSNFLQLSEVLPMRTVDNQGYLFSYEEISNDKNWITHICKNYQIQVPLSQQLMKLGDVSDRLYWDDDKGHYCIEKKINMKTLNGSESGWYFSTNSDTGSQFRWSNATIKNRGAGILGSHGEGLIWGGTGNNNNSIYLSIRPQMGLDEFKKWLESNPVNLIYELATPEIIDLPHLNEPLKLYQRDNTTIAIDSNIKPSKTTINYKDIQDYK